ncbi:hypothetical protein P167DRAFT_548405 [Morchella conica CCBAS932]|uniref:Uncharacterized protein n=1 Tax=Morchella conica CCBAS932 TaxID=1392247 RepID=A0A3N4KER2_9PEZI|nr:hypothetical protein P167DRAFT_548405 [Morchella conica CCBAS932]
MARAKNVGPDPLMAVHAENRSIYTLFLLSVKVDSSALNLSRNEHDATAFYLAARQGFVSNPGSNTYVRLHAPSMRNLKQQHHKDTCTFQARTLVMITLPACTYTYVPVMLHPAGDRMRAVHAYQRRENVWLNKGLVLCSLSTVLQDLINATLAVLQGTKKNNNMQRWGQLQGMRTEFHTSVLPPPYTTTPT